jgi:hypothetical protein
MSNVRVLLLFLFIFCVRDPPHTFAHFFLCELCRHLQQKFVPIKDGGAAENAASFGHVRPRHEVTEDVAISAVPNVAMGKFSLDQVKEWLMAVAVPAATTAGANDSASNGAPKENFTAEAALIVSYITKLTAADAAEVAARAARRELPQSSIFGTVTVSNRLKRYRSTSTTSVGTKLTGLLRFGCDDCC